MKSWHTARSTEVKQTSTVSGFKGSAMFQGPSFLASLSLCHSQWCPHAYTDSRRAAAVPGHTSRLKNIQRNERNPLFLWFFLGSKDKLPEAYPLVFSHLSLADIGYMVALEPSIGKRSGITLMLIRPYVELKVASSSPEARSCTGKMYIQE